MITVLNQISLRTYHTFGMDVQAEYLIEVFDNQEFKEAIQWAEDNVITPVILGGGSNVLFTQAIYPLVIVNRIKGIDVVEENEDFVWVRSGAGEIWHELVMYCVAHGWGGIENLSLIPGTVGAAPMQNIGAYGVEIKEVFESLEAMDRTNFDLRQFTREACQFGYRESVFKTTLKGKYFITSVVLKLQKKPKVNISYGAIQAVLKARGIVQPTIQEVSDAVIEIRQSKLPDPAVIGNAGSFFKNPVIHEEAFERLSAKYPDMPNYPQTDGQVKIPAGWLIEQLGWKGQQEGQIGVHKNQALVLVNYGQGKGEDLLNLADRIKASVLQQFDIEIIPEVNIL